jgi:hypothetical protein
MARVNQINFAGQGPQNTQQDVQKIKMADALMKRGSSSESVGSPLEGLGRASQAWVGALMQRNQDEALRKRQDDYSGDMSLAMQALQGGTVETPRNDDTQSFEGPLAPKTYEGGMAGILGAIPDMQSNEARSQFGNMAMMQALQKPDRGFTTLSSDQAAQMDLGPGVWQQSTDGQISPAYQPVKPGALEQNLIAAGYKPGTPEFAEAARLVLERKQKPGVSIDNTYTAGAPEDPFLKKLAENEASAFGDMMSVGTKAGRNLKRIDRLEALLKGVPTGATATLQQFAGKMGIKTEGLSEIEAASAMISSMIPEQRAPGSGTMSDADLNIFKDALPKMMNTEGGNQLIIQTIREINEYDRQIGEIASAAAKGAITRAVARDQMNAINNPLEGFTVDEPEQIGALPEGATARNPKTGERRVVRNGQWVKM